MSAAKELLDLLVCPVCKQRVEMTADEQGLCCPACGRIYPIRDGFPVMIKDDAKLPSR